MFIVATKSGMVSLLLVCELQEATRKNDKNILWRSQAECQPQLKPRQAEPGYKDFRKVHCPQGT